MEPWCAEARMAGLVQTVVQGFRVCVGGNRSGAPIPCLIGIHFAAPQTAGFLEMKGLQQRYGEQGPVFPAAWVAGCYI